MDSPSERVIYTIGHSNKSFEAFAELLARHEIDVVADVRSSPYARYAVHFSTQPLEAALKDYGYRYVWLGKQIGGMPKDPDFHDEFGHVRYDLVAASPAFKAGIDRLMNGLDKFKIALMCAEENPTGCHRRNLIAPALRARDVDVVHIRGTGAIQTELELQTENGEIEVPPDTVQLRLF